MKKLLSSRWTPVLFGVVLMIATAIGLGIWAKQMVSGNQELQKRLKELQAKAQAEAAADGNATKTKKEEKITDAGKTESNELYEATEEETTQIIEGAFETLNNMTDPGMLRFDNPALPRLLSALSRKDQYLRQREREIMELEAHINEQLRELNWHTNRITRSQAEIDKLFESRYAFYKQQEVTRLQNLARIYEGMDQEDDDYGTKITQFLQANQQIDKNLNAKIFLHLSPATQAKMLEELATGTPASQALYQEIIKSHLKTMPGPGVTGAGGTNGASVPETTP